LGGVARKTRETILLCEAAGFDLILVETVGVGQSETTVRSLVDFFILLALTGAGDELQGIKKGIMELADMIVVTKADGDNARRALGTMAELKQVLHYITPATPGWESVVQSCSALTGEGIPEIWTVAQRFFEEGEKAGWIGHRRRLQSAQWFRSLLEEAVLRGFFEQRRVRELLPVLEERVISGRIGATEATRQILEAAARQE
ncbi:MAG: methylmalonyl Co-A mutase-associated GTPase MeaB, partial [Verrucomicrobiia bacterium]